MAVFYWLVAMGQGLCWLYSVSSQRHFGGCVWLPFRRVENGGTEQQQQQRLNLKLRSKMSDKTRTIFQLHSPLVLIPQLGSTESTLQAKCHFDENLL